MLISGLAFTDGSSRKPERPGSAFRALVVAAAALGALAGALAGAARRRRG